MSILCRGSWLVLLWLVLGATPSQAKVLITTGDTFSSIGTPTAEQQELINLMWKFHGQNGTAHVGYKYSYYGVFWLDFWTSDGEYCLYQDKTYIPLDKDVAARFLGKEPHELGTPFWYRFPAGLVIVAGFVVLIILGSVLNKRDQKKYAQLLEDPIYQKAIQIFDEQQALLDQAATLPTEGEPATPTEPLDPQRPHNEAVDYLVQQGIGKIVAEENMKLIELKRLEAFQAAKGG